MPSPSLSIDNLRTGVPQGEEPLGHVDKPAAGGFTAGRRCASTLISGMEIGVTSVNVVEKCDGLEVAMIKSV